MLSNKNAGIGFPFTYIISIVLLVVVITVFMMYFFVFGGAQSKVAVIESDKSMSTLKLPLIMNTKLSELKIGGYENSNDTMYDLLIQSYTSTPPDHQKFVNQLSQMLSKLRLPMPTKAAEPSLALSGWNFRAYTLDKTPISSLAVVNGLSTEEIGKESESAKYYDEKMLVPIKNSNPIIIELYLSCLSCTDDYLGGYA